MWSRIWEPLTEEEFGILWVLTNDLAARIGSADASPTSLVGSQAAVVAGDDPGGAAAVGELVDALRLLVSERHHRYGAAAERH